MVTTPPDFLSARESKQKRHWIHMHRKCKLDHHLKADFSAWQCSQYIRGKMGERDVRSHTLIRSGMAAIICSANVRTRDSSSEGTESSNVVSGWPKKQSGNIPNHITQLFHGSTRRQNIDLYYNLTTRKPSPSTFTQSRQSLPHMHTQRLSVLLFMPHP